MNYKMVKYVLGWIAIFEAGFLLIPVITSLVYGEWNELWALLITVGACLAVGSLGAFTFKPTNKQLFAKEGFVITSLAWVIMSLLGCMPFIISGVIPNFIDALFETVSGFTTTGSSIIPAVEQVPKCLLMWRSFTHWIGGMGVLVFVMAILPLSGAHNMNMMKAESPGPDVGKLVPKVKNTAIILYGIYIVLTVVMFIFLLCGRMTVFEAANTAFATAGTGGFGFKNDSMASYSKYLQWVITVFMLLFSVNFNAYYLVLCRKFKQAFSTEVKTFFIIVIVAIVLVVLNMYQQFATLSDAILHSSFSVATIISTTGFATVDFGLWPSFAQGVLLVVMMIGACAGSTGGGMKVSRVVLLGKQAGREFSHLIHPKQVKRITMDGQPVDRDVIRGVNVYMICYALIFTLSVLIISLDGHDFLTNFSAVGATINNIGPGLSKVGPSGNFAFFSPLSKITMIFDMLVGRLEFFPILILFMPGTWKK